MRIAVYGIEDGMTAEAEVYDVNGRPAASIRAVRSGNELTVTVEGSDKPYTVESPQELTIKKR